jgi:hypothetical protein
MPQKFSLNLKPLFLAPFFSLEVFTQLSYSLIIQLEKYCEGR